MIINNLTKTRKYEMVDTTKRTRRMRIKIEFKVLKRIKIEL